MLNEKFIKTAGEVVLHLSDQIRAFVVAIFHGLLDCFLLLFNERLEAFWDLSYELLCLFIPLFI